MHPKPKLRRPSRRPELSRLPCPGSLTDTQAVDNVLFECDDHVVLVCVLR